MTSCASVFDSTLAAAFADETVTVAVTFGSAPTAQDTRGIFTSEDVPESDGLGGVMVVHRQIVVVRDKSLTDPGTDQPISPKSNDQPIVVDGQTYTIHDVRSGGRGRTRVILA